FAPVDFTSSDLTSLPGTLTEINALDSLFQSHAKTSLFTYASATRSILTDDVINQYTIIHLATHGLVNETNPELSCIYTSGTTQANDRIYSGNIYNMHLNAELVTLSACQTGLGKISKGEGMIGLSRALFYSGADNIMVSLWSVPDISTQLLMKDFYKNYLDAKTSASFHQASRAAKLQLIQSELYSSPYYWGAFVLIGE
ncbi:MAG: CHAT domain-containing protein, partial [Cytophagales bacterium]|nr:CHAT domain-containing protein [Cytophaga sp.]